MPVIRTSSGTAYNVLLTGIKYTVDAGYEPTLVSSNIGSYNRFFLQISTFRPAGQILTGRVGS